jgi:hypothetical protein
MRIQLGILLVAMMIGTACMRKPTRLGAALPPPPQGAAAPPPTGEFGIEPINTAIPLADYYVCRFTPQQSAVFTFAYDTHQQVLMVTNRFVSAANQTAAKEAVYSSHPFTAQVIVQALLEKNLITAGDAAALTEQIEEAIAAAGTNSANTVGCSQSLMTWNETRHMFGRAIADNYLAVQVNVRNMDGDNEFLLHDSQVAFRDLPGAAQGNTLFVGARDRVLARGLQQATTWDSRRNLSVLLASAIGSFGVAAGAVTGGPSLRDAFSVFNGTFVPFLDGKVPDLSVAQLRMMDDMVYSSANAYHIVVPTKGTVPFVIFVPLNVYVGTAKSFREMAQSDLRQWADRMFVVVAGVHITQVNPAVGLTKLTCPVSSTGALDLSNTADAAKTRFACEVGGTSLNTIAKIRLRNSKASTDSVTAEGMLAVDGGSTTTGKVTFDVSSLIQLTGTQYNAFLVLASGQETSTSLTVTLAPVIDSVSLHLATCPANQKCELQVAGRNLGLLDAAVILTSGSSALNGATLGTCSPTSCAISFTSPATALSASSQLTLTLTAGGKPVSTPVVTITQ